MFRPGQPTLPSVRGGDLEKSLSGKGKTLARSMAGERNSLYIYVIDALRLPCLFLVEVECVALLK